VQKVESPDAWKLPKLPGNCLETSQRRPNIMGWSFPVWARAFAFEAIIRRVHEHVANGRGVKNARVIERGKLHDQ
jgi:hypothetical protein